MESAGPRPESGGGPRDEPETSTQGSDAGSKQMRKGTGEGRKRAGDIRRTRRWMHRRNPGYVEEGALRGTRQDTDGMRTSGDYRRGHVRLGGFRRQEMYRGKRWRTISPTSKGGTNQISEVHVYHVHRTGYCPRVTWTRQMSSTDNKKHFHPKASHKPCTSSTNHSPIVYSLTSPHVRRVLEPIGTVDGRDVGTPAVALQDPTEPTPRRRRDIRLVSTGEGLSDTRATVGPGPTAPADRWEGVPPGEGTGTTRPGLGRT